MLTIRRATREDTAAIMALLAQIDQQHIDAEPHFFQHADPPRDEAFMDSWLNHPERHTQLAMIDEQVVGCVMYVTRQLSNMLQIVKSRTFVHIDNIVTDRDHRGQGVGTALIQTVHDWAAAQGIHEIQLGVWAFNSETLAFYEKMGYRIFYHQMIRVE